MNLENLLKENSGLLSRMKERDGNENLAKVIDSSFIASLKNKN